MATSQLLLVSEEALEEQCCPRKSVRPPKVVVLVCMAERLKDKILDADKMVDVVCGPDAYRDLPRLLEEVDYGQKGMTYWIGFPLNFLICDSDTHPPHPKDFPDDLRYRYNICKSIHLPAQSGNSEVLERMRRGYTREAYLDLVEKIPDDSQIGTTQLVLVEGPNRRAPETELIGKSDKGHRVIFTIMLK